MRADQNIVESNATDQTFNQSMIQERRLNGIQKVRGSNPLSSTKRDVYAHSAFMSELETALSVSFSFSGIFVHVMSLILNNYT